MTTSRKILVTGGAGFIGSALCKYLIEQGNHVLCLDNYFTGSRKHTSYLQDHPHFASIYHDLIHPIELDVDAIYHLACPASPRYYQRDPIYTLKTNVWGTMNMLELAKSLKIPILLASTSEVYGNPKQHPQPESYTGNVNPIGPRACYDEGKRVAETLCFDYARMYGVSIRVVRIFNTYGPGMKMNDGRVVSNLIVQALQGKPLTIYGDGTQTRSLCYVTDLVSGLEIMMNHSRRLQGPINLGNPHELRIIDLAKLIVQYTGSTSHIDYLPIPEDDPALRQPDITLAKKCLNWEPQVPIDTGLHMTIAYFKKLLKEGGLDENS
jgi:UDP-glucuronate decarboxylase